MTQCFTLISNIFKNKGNTNYIGRYRETQEAYAQCCASILDKRDSGVSQVALLEAGTGVGKSLGYLVPLLLKSAQTASRVAISTFSRQLQRQLKEDIEKACKIIEPITNKKLTVATRFGTDEYIDIETVEHYVQYPDSSWSHEDIELVIELRDWLYISLDEKNLGYQENVTTGRYSDFLEQKSVDSLPKGLKKSEICIKPYHGSYEKSCHQRDVERSKNTDVLIVTHAMLMLHIKTNAELLDDERAIEYLVIDEADKISSAAELIFEGSFSINTYKKSLQKLSENHLTMQDANEKYIQLADYLFDLSDSVKEKPHALYKDSSTLLKIKNLSSSFLVAAKKGLSLSNITTEDYKIACVVQAFIHELSGFVDVISNEYHQSLVLPFVKWSEIYEYPSLQLSAINTGFLTQRLFRNVNNEEQRQLFKKIIYTSATLTTSGYGQHPDFEAFTFMAGIKAALKENKCEVVKQKVFSVGEYGKISTILSEHDTHHPLIKYNNGFDYHPSLLKRVLSFVCFSLSASPLGDCGNRTLVLCTSFRESVVLSNYLRDNKIEVLEHCQGESLQSLLSRFRENKKAVLVTPSAWEGFDERIANLVISRLPFAPIDSVVNAKIIFMEERGFNKSAAKSIISKQLNFETQRKLTQGIGRLIRKQEDTGRLMIADSRAKKHNDERWEELLGKRPFKSTDISKSLKSKSQFDSWVLATSLDGKGSIINANKEVRGRYPFI